MRTQGEAAWGRRKGIGRLGTNLTGFLGPVRAWVLACNMERKLVLLTAGPCVDYLEKAGPQPRLALPLWVIAGSEKRW